MSRRFASPIPAVNTLVTGILPRFGFVNRRDDGPRIEHRAFARRAEKLDVAVDDVVEHDDAALIADAAGVVRAFHAGCAGRFASGGDLFVLPNLPGA